MHPTQKQANPVEVTPAFALRAAAIYIERYGWTTGDFYFHPGSAEDSDDWPAACASGAIAVSVHGRVITENPFDDDLQGWPLATAARDALYDHLVSIGEIAFDVSDPDPRTTEDWNDHPEQTREAVVAALRAAADDWDRTHGGAL